MALASVFNAIGSLSQDNLTETTADLSANQTSGPWLSTGDKFNWSYQFVIASGTPTGNFIVEVCNDMRARDQFGSANVIWTTVQVVAFTAGLNNGNANCNVTVQNGNYASRCRWVATSGSGQGYANGYGVSI